MLARLECYFGLGDMQARGRAEVDDVDVVAGEKRVVGGRRADAVAVGDGLGLRRIDVAERDQLELFRQPDQRVDVLGADPAADDRDPEPCAGRCRHRFIADMATPRMIRRWKNRKKTNTGTSESVDMANSWPQADSPWLSTNARSASGTV